MPNDNEKIVRKLRAIFSADVKGYSLMMSDDEEHTIQTLKLYRQIMSDFIQQNSGRVVDNPGDNLLAEFSSAVDAVGCAVQIQNRLRKENAKFVEDKRLEFRIGVNIGDVVHDGDRLYGSGVNIAARIEGIADSGGICISRNAYDHVKDKLDFGFEYLGEHAVKNIKEPVRVYKILMDSEPVKPLVEEKLELPDKPSIAVLPFTNMSGDPEQEYFSDGLTEQIINGLCKVSNLFVIARNSSFAYKGKTISVKQVAKELGVRYILEGSVQRAGNRVRITAQLIDATTDYHMWSDNYDRDLGDIFALQDEITGNLISAMDIQLIHGEQAKYWDVYKNIQAYDKFMRGLESIQLETHKDNINAISLLQESISIEESATGYALLGYAHYTAISRGWSDSIPSSFEQVEMCAKKSLELNSSLDVSHRIMALVHLHQRAFDQARAEGKLALKLSPNGAETHAWFAFILGFIGEAKQAIDHLIKAIRLNPIPPFHYYMFLGFAYRLYGDYRKAIDASTKALKYNPDQILTYLVMASSYAKLDELPAAKNAVENLLRVGPSFSLKYYAETRPYKNKSDLDDMIDSLRKAGLPD